MLFSPGLTDVKWPKFLQNFALSSLRDRIVIYSQISIYSESMEKKPFHKLNS